MSGRTSPSSLSLVMADMSKRFGQTVALDNAHLAVRAGTLHALLGENGAGKSTLMRIAFGMVRADSGSVSLNGAVQRFQSSADAIASGLGMVHQHFLLVGAMTVAENVALGDVRARGGLAWFDPGATAVRVRKIGEQSGLQLDPSALVEDLSVASQQRLELVKALARQARLLILDEPTAVLAPSEAAELYHWLREFVSRGGTAVVVTHRLRDALENADDVTVLRRGRTVLAAPARDLVAPAVVQAMLGEQDVPAIGVPTRSTAAPGPVVLALDDVSLVDAAGVARLRGASIAVRAGEVVGIVAAEGSGHREVLRILAGRLTATTGSVRRPGTVGFVPEDRLHDALIPELTLIENAALVDAGTARGVLEWRELARRTELIVSTSGLVSAGATSTIAELSGGNQQKFVLWREILVTDRALVVENPTRGLDLRAAARVTAGILRAARERGVAVVLYSSDFEEVLAIADRVYVCFGGELRELTNRDVRTVTSAIVGAA